MFSHTNNPAQDKAALNYLKNQKDDIGKIDNCSARTSNALKAAGIDASSMFPKKFSESTYIYRWCQR